MASLMYGMSHNRSCWVSTLRIFFDCKLKYKIGYHGDEVRHQFEDGTGGCDVQDK